MRYGVCEASTKLPCCDQPRYEQFDIVICLRHAQIRPCYFFTRFDVLITQVVWINLALERDVKLKVLYFVVCRVFDDRVCLFS